MMVTRSSRDKTTIILALQLKPKRLTIHQNPKGLHCKYSYFSPHKCIIFVLCKLNMKGFLGFFWLKVIIKVMNKCHLATCYSGLTAHLQSSGLSFQRKLTYSMFLALYMDIMECLANYSLCPGLTEFVGKVLFKQLLEMKRGKGLCIALHVLYKQRG